MTGAKPRRKMHGNARCRKLRRVSSWAVYRRDGPGVSFPHNWGSAHSGSAQFLLADGSVRAIPFQTPETTLNALLTPTGGEVVPNW